MRKLFYSLAVIIIALLLGKTMQAQAQILKAQDGNYLYEYVQNDPLGVRIYTLNNGLKVYLSVNKDEPRIQTAIAVKVGSKNDPRNNTGLAHYLEHMMFKGTSKIATTNWSDESKLLNQISDLYEKHKATDNPDEKKYIYHQIDSISGLAAKLSIPSEYDKMVSSLGAKGTNAFTSVDQTVYINDIPSTEIEKWLYLEAERFNELVLRLFHTELEAVYEEFNMGQDRDDSKVYEAMLKALYQKHPAQISTIGLGEHLKNPSMKAIHNFWETYYVPNNMAICLSGDLDPSETIRLIDKYFGKLKNKPTPKFSFEPETPIEKPILIDVYGKETEYVQLAYRFDGAGTNDEMMLALLDGIFQNGKAGIMDINLIQKQKILSGGAYKLGMKDYNAYVIEATPRDGQTLEEAKNLLLQQIEVLKKGDFSNDLIPAVIKNTKLSRLKSYETNRGRFGYLFTAFINDLSWDYMVNYVDNLGKITKNDVVKFANQKFKNNNYVVVYKKQGEDKTSLKVDKPAITKVELNRNNQSEFLKTFEQIPSKRLTPLFLDFDKDIQKTKLATGLELNYIKNTTNPTFNLYYILDMGANNNKKLDLAIQYLPLLGTDKYTPEQLQLELYKLGVSMNVSASEDRCYITLSGLEESFDDAVKLFEHVLKNAKPNEQAYKDLVDGIIKKRNDAKQDKNTIFWSGLYNYATYGKNSAATNILSKEELGSINPQELTDLIHQITDYKHYIFYYGSRDIKEVQGGLNRLHNVNCKNFKDYPKPTTFTELEMPEDKSFFVHYDMVQAQIGMTAKDDKFNKDYYPFARVFNEYFGSGLSSIVFQEIRESRALAYSAFASYELTDKPQYSNNTFGFMAVQVDKMKDAITAMRELLNNMPQAEKQFNNAINAVQKRIESERIVKTNLFFTYLRNKDLGINYDIRKDIYEKSKNMKISELTTFFNQRIKNKKYHFIVMGNRDKVNIEYLKSLGEFKELSLEEIFNY